MKYKLNYTMLLILSSLLFWNCSSDDENSGTNPQNQNYFPLVVENQWNYENTQTTDEASQTSAETLSVESESNTENGSTYNLESTSTQAGVSFTSILSNGDVFKNDGKLLLSGNVDLDIDQVEIPNFDINFEDLVVYDTQAVEGSILFTDDQVLNLPEFNDISLTLSLSIESKSLGEFQNFDANGELYENVIGSEFIVSIGVDATTTVAPFPFPITIAVIEFQEVVNSTNYFANEVGLIQSETNLNISFSEELSQVPNFNLEDISSQIQQALIDYQVSLED